jgi:hypothetical protein
MSAAIKGDKNIDRRKAKSLYRLKERKKAKRDI